MPISNLPNISVQSRGKTMGFGPMIAGPNPATETNGGFQIFRHRSPSGDYILFTDTRNSGCLKITDCVCLHRHEWGP